MSGIKNLLKRAAFGAALAVCTATPILKSSPAEAWWRGGWGWHTGWGWHAGWGWHPGWGGVYVGLPPVVVAAAPYGPGYRFIPGYYAPGGYWVAPHWGYY